MTATPIRYHADYEADGLFRAVVEYPLDLRPRLVLADRLDEIGEGERAEFIRVQCEISEVFPPCRRETAKQVFRRHSLMDREQVLVDAARSWPEFMIGGAALTDRPCMVDNPTAYSNHRGDTTIFLLRNGFVEEVRCPLGWWLGGECEMCDMVARHPVTRVVVTDREPMPNSAGAGYHWSLGYPGYEILPCDLPEDVFDKMNHSGLYSRLTMPGAMLFFPTREAAETALSRALVGLARERVGLPAIHWEGQSS